MLVGGYTFYNTYLWPNNDSAAGGVVGGGGRVSDTMGGENLLRRRLLSDSTARHDGSGIIWNGKFITYYIVYIII